jgi:hypothetical protein
MLREFPLRSQHLKGHRVVWNWMQKIRNQDAALRTQPQSVKICIVASAAKFLLNTRYLFPWFGFNASEFTCANLAIKGDPLDD